MERVGEVRKCLLPDLVSQKWGSNCGLLAYKASVLPISSGPSPTLQDSNIKKGTTNHQPRDTSDLYKLEKNDEMWILSQSFQKEENLLRL